MVREGGGEGDAEDGGGGGGGHGEVEERGVLLDLGKEAEREGGKEGGVEKGKGRETTKWRIGCRESLHTQCVKDRMDTRTMSLSM